MGVLRERQLAVPKDERCELSAIREGLQLLHQRPQRRRHLRIHRRTLRCPRREILPKLRCVHEVRILLSLLKAIPQGDVQCRITDPLHADDDAMKQCLGPRHPVIAIRSGAFLHRTP